MSRQFINSINDRYQPNQFYVMEGFDDCVIGYDFTNSKLIYSETLLINQLCLTMEFDDALDYYYFNIIDTIKDKVIICSTMGE